MFQVLAPVVVAPTAEARQALGAQLKEAGLAAWREIARQGQGLEMAHFQLTDAGVTLAVCSRLRRDGFVVIELGLGDPRQAARSITMAELRRAETRAHRRKVAPVSPAPCRAAGVLWLLTAKRPMRYQPAAATISLPHPKHHAARSVRPQVARPLALCWRDQCCGHSPSLTLAAPACRRSTPSAIRHR